jgi:hypothetical protein
MRKSCINNRTIAKIMIIREEFYSKNVMWSVLRYNTCSDHSHILIWRWIILIKLIWWLQSLSRNSIIIKARVTVELDWTRARASNPRFGQGWTYPSRPSGSDGLRFLSGRVGRVEIFVRAGYSSSDFCPTDWIEQTYLSVGHPIRISVHTKCSDWVANPRVGHRILFDGLSWTSNPVRRVGLGGQPCPSPSPGLARVSWP